MQPGSVDFEDSSRLHDRGLLLAFRESDGALAVNVNAGEFFAVAVIDGHLPVTVFPAAVAVESAGFFGFCLFH
jgi:hypothetical protein